MERQSEKKDRMNSASKVASGMTEQVRGVAEDDENKVVV